MSLWSSFVDHSGLPVHKWRHYFPAYESHFRRFVDRPVTLLEIGVSKGGSLQLWKRYLGPHAQIVGVDINPECARFEEEQIAVRIGSQSDVTFLRQLLDEFGPPHIIIDDGSHVMSDISNTFNFLYPRMRDDGVYFVEDLHTAYWHEYGGGLRNGSSFIEEAKLLIDELNADWTRGELDPTDFTRSTLSMHFYDSCLVLERGRHLPKTAPIYGRASD